jgi:hypothetical protein
MSFPLVSVNGGEVFEPAAPASDRDDLVTYHPKTSQPTSNQNRPARWDSKQVILRRVGSGGIFED